jgi:hypothetical protein
MKMGIAKGMHGHPLGDSRQLVRWNVESILGHPLGEFWSRLLKSHWPHILARGLVREAGKFYERHGIKKNTLFLRF